MALATDLAIYHDAYELLTLTTKLTGQYHRNFRDLARDIRAEATAVVKSIYTANCTRDKAPAIQRLREHLGTLQLFFRLSTDLRQISPGQFGSTVKLTTAVSKQATGWLNYAKARA
ncbi:four helix bundle protein [Telmatospirillum sp.]|uniref:four helix bundle protein n=1 Tax=Telmatospirillum sp. TaxID=2079197 RepID=UPI00283AC984|nr:four helix bundle protein [Telmatospirillum sp.]MDR3438992.1 four helix bundle protein [Telmatospirillum sp.]